MTPRILVLYGTTEGQTRKIACALEQALEDCGAEVDVAQAGAGTPQAEAKPSAYDAVIVAASVHAGRYQRAVRRWAAGHADRLNAMPTAFISVCLAVVEHSPKADRAIADIMDAFLAKVGWKPTNRKVVAGALVYSKYGWLKRRLMRRIVAKAHGDIDMSRDYEYTDWADLRAFAQDFHQSLMARLSMGTLASELPGVARA